MARRRKTVLEELEKLKESSSPETEKDEKETLTEMENEEEDLGESENYEPEMENEEDISSLGGLDEADEDPTDEDSEELKDETEDKFDEAEEELDDTEEEFADAEGDDTDLDALNSKLDDIISSIEELKNSLDSGEDTEEDTSDEEVKESSNSENKIETMEGNEEMYRQEDFSPLFDDEKSTLSEEFKTKANVVFNAVLAEKVHHIASKLAKKSELAVNKKTKKLMETVLNDVNDYFEYLSEQWMEENKLAVEMGIRNNLVENVLFKFKKALAESYIDLPDEDLTLIEELNTKTKTLRKQVDSVLAENIKLKRVLVESNKKAIQTTIAEGLNSLEVDRFKKLAKAIDFESAEQYSRDLKTLKETVSRKVSNSSSSNEVKEVLKETSSSQNKKPIVESDVYLDISKIDPSKNFTDYKRNEPESAIEKYVSSLTQTIRI